MDDERSRGHHYGDEAMTPEEGPAPEGAKPAERPEFLPGDTVEIIDFSERHNSKGQVTSVMPGGIAVLCADGQERRFDVSEIVRAEPASPPSPALIVHEPGAALRSPAPAQAEPPKCRGCGRELRPECAWVADGCECNSPRGINHGLVPRRTCTCKACDPEQTGGTRRGDEDTATEQAQEFLDRSEGRHRAYAALVAEHRGEAPQPPAAPGTPLTVMARVLRRYSGSDALEDFAGQIADELERAQKGGEK